MARRLSRHLIKNGTTSYVSIPFYIVERLKLDQNSIVEIEEGFDEVILKVRKEQ